MVTLISITEFTQVLKSVKRITDIDHLEVIAHMFSLSLCEYPMPMSTRQEAQDVVSAYFYSKLDEINAWVYLEERYGDLMSQFRSNGNLMLGAVGVIDEHSLWINVGSFLPS